MSWFPIRRDPAAPNARAALRATPRATGRLAGPVTGIVTGKVAAVAAGLLAVLVTSMGTVSCASWHPVERRAGWTLYVADGASVKIEEFNLALEPAFIFVEETLGPFKAPVRIHAFHGGVGVADDGRRTLVAGGDGLTEPIAGIGPTRVRAFHSRGGPFEAPGIFLGVADVGTAVHELVHARLAEESRRLPLWFEEGLATLLGDGALFEGRWVVDGLAYWPLVELNGEELDDACLARLLLLDAGDHPSLRDDALTRFVGWAVLFDLYRRVGHLHPFTWFEEFEEGRDAAHLRTHLMRTLAPETIGVWLQRLDDPDPGVRFATARGAWKLGSLEVYELLLNALEKEQHAEVSLGLAINLLCATGELDLKRDLRGRSWRAIRRALSTAQPADPSEAAAVTELGRSLRFWWRRGADTRPALDALARYWRE
ncbi:MAG: hypothetical protein QF724_04115 [Planctomycetota bacterium]|nr:hypothetical protein [Planctomycetota bacterium]